MTDPKPAQVGDHISLQHAPRAVMSCAMNEKPDEFQVIGLVPAADGMRVAIGAGFRHPESYDKRIIKKPPAHVLCAVLDPQQALETSVLLGQLAVQAAHARGEVLMMEPTQDLLAQARAAGLSQEEAMEQAATMPGQAIMAEDGNAAIGGMTMKPYPAQVAYVEGAVAEDGMIGLASIQMPDGSEWVCIVAKQLVPEDAPQVTVAMPVQNAMDVCDALMTIIQAAADRSTAAADRKAS